MTTNCLSSEPELRGVELRSLSWAAGPGVRGGLSRAEHSRPSLESLCSDPND